MAEEYSGPTCSVCGKQVTVGPRCQSCAQQERSRQAVTPTDIEMVEQHFEQGHSLRRIASERGISHERVRVRIKRAVDSLPELEKRRLWGDR